MSKFSVVTVGNSNLDIFLKIHDANRHARISKESNKLCFSYGQKILVDTAEFLAGGGATNVAVGLSRLGLSVGLVAEIGDDELSQKILNSLKKEKVDISNLTRTKGASTSFAVGINFKGERTLFVHHVKREHNFSFADIQTDWVYLGGLGRQWQTACKNTVNFVKSSGAKLAFAPGTTQVEAGYSAIAEVLKAADILFLNKEEATQVLSIKYQVSGIDELLKALKKTGPKVVIITDGQNGSQAIDEKGTVFNLGIVPADVVEKTGAGDAYTSGFLGALSLGLSIKEAMSWGTINAASVIGKVGAQEGLLTREEIAKKL